ncbi:MAG: hypothetical protein ACK415_05470 [Thermodesulfovibrionales bacterium]
MSGIDLLLSTAIDYERTHQTVLSILLSRPKMAEVLLNIVNPREKIHWEPAGQLFDLAVDHDNTTTYVEIKMWSPLIDKQLEDQVAFLQKNNARGVYLLLGTSWFEHTEKDISKMSNGSASRIGYDELISSLNKLMVVKDQPPEIYELALAYRNAVQKQFDRIRTAYNSNENKQLFFYSIYHEIQTRLKDMETYIHTMSNQGGPVYILTKSDPLKFTYEGVNSELYHEIVNGRLCIKFWINAPNETKYKLRDNLRKAIREVYGADYRVIDSGRLGECMTACQIEHDFTDVKNFEESARIFSDVGLKLKKVRESIKG